MKKFLEVRNVTFSSSNDHKLVKVSFNIQNPGDIISILGPSGVGKTTILRAIAGLEKINEGEIWLNNILISSKNKFIEPEERGVALSFQDNSLFPHLNVRENLLLGIKRNSKIKTEN